MQSQANALQQVISEREEAITEKDGLVKKVQAIEEERVLEKQMGELVEQELSEKKKLEDELHRKNDIIKTFVNQEFKNGSIHYRLRRRVQNGSIYCRPRRVHYCTKLVNLQPLVQQLRRPGKCGGMSYCEGRCGGPPSQRPAHSIKRVFGETIMCVLCKKNE